MLSVTITVSGDNAERRSSFHEMMGSILLQDNQDYELILVEQFMDQPVWEEVSHTYNAVHIPIKDELFNLSWCRNVGIRNASYDRVLVLDADLILPCDYFTIVMNSPYEYALGWNRVVRLNQKGKERYLAIREFTDEWSEDEYRGTLRPLKGNAGQGISAVFDKDWFFNVLGGYCEDFTLWGQEDCELMNRARILTGEWYFLESTLLHLYHRDRQRSGTNAAKLEISRKDPIAFTQRLIKADLGKFSHPTHVIIPGE